MILRTLSKAVRSQNWFTAVIEFVIVVAGIFAGLQVDDWNQGRNDRIVEHQYLERLLFDMEESVAAQKVILDTRDQAIDHVDQATRLLKSKSITEANIEIVAQGLDWLGFIALPMTNLVTIRELQSTGNLSLLREVKVRKALGELELSHNTLEHWAEKNLLVFSAMLPKLMTWGYVVLSSDSEDGYIVEPDIEAIYSHPGAANMLSYMNSWTQYHGSLVEQHHQKTIAFRDLLQSALQNSR